MMEEICTQGKKLLIVCQTFGYLMADITKTFVESNRYEKIVVITGDTKNALSFGIVGVDIDKMYPYRKDSMKSRFVSWVKGFRDIKKKVRHVYRDYELFLVSNPGSIAFLHLFCRNKYYSLTWDLFPDGFLTSPTLGKIKPLLWLWGCNNKQFYAKAEAVFCITEGMANAMAKYVSREKINVVPLWANDRIEKINVAKKDNMFLQQYNLTNRFIVQYSGNMGQGHSLGTLVEAAALLRDTKNICFLFIGDGWLKPHLQEMVKEYGIEDTCIFLPYQPEEMLPYSFSCSDIAVVSLHAVSVSMPSKTFDIIRMGKPVICIADPSSSLSKFVKENGFGECFTKDHAKDIARFILEAYTDSTFLMSFEENAKKCASIYTREKQATKFLV